MKSPLFPGNILFRFILFIFCFLITTPSFSQARVIGGTDADIKDFPWQVAVDYGCGGTIIGDSWVLTAAHCVVGGANVIYAGNSAPYASGGETYSVANVITHPLYGSGTSYSHDFALVEIEGEFNFTNPNIGKIDLITAADVSAGSEDPGVIATITGWGTIDDGSMATSLQMAQAPIVGNDVACGSTTDSNGNSGDYSCSSLDGSMICAGDLVDGGEDACQGDSGGPLIVRSLIDNRWVLIGATSWGYGCADVNYPGVWARVSYVLDWVEDNADINSEYGCMDTLACNFSAEAIYNVPESCVFEVDECGECGGSGPPSGYDCDGNCLSGETLNISMSDTYGDGWNGSNLVVNGQSVTLITGSSATEILCFDSIQGCNEVIVSAGSYASEVSWTISDADGNVLLSGGAPYSGGFGAENCGPPILGCTDSSALNYNSEASQDDGTCQFPIICSDSSTSVLIEVTEGGWPSEVSWEINDSLSGGVGETLVCLQDGCYNFKMLDSYGDGWNGSEVTVSDSSGVLLNGTLSSGSEGILAFSLNYEDSCLPVILGCTDSLAINYNVDATLDDGSCQAPIDCSGLTSVYIQVTDGSYPSEISWEVGGFSGGVGAQSVCLPDGCFSLILQDSYGDGWNGAFISVSDSSGSLINNETLNTGSEGVLVFSLNYEGECLPTISGCTDSSAINYNAEATLDDGACQYPIDCDSLTTVSIDVGGGSWQSEVSWEIGGFTGGVGLTEACINDGCLVFNMYDSYGDGWNGNDVTISDSSGVLLTGTLNSGSEGLLNFGFNYEGDCGNPVDVPGCTNPAADNYDSLATVDDGSCETDECVCPEVYDPVCGSDGVTYSNDCVAACEDLSSTPGECSNLVSGCMDSLACNFDTLAEQNDGSCYNNDLGCGCDQPAAELGYDCDGNAIPIACGDSTLASYTYSDYDYESFDYLVDSNEVAVLSISGRTESCCDDVYVYDGSGNLLASLSGYFTETIVSNDNGITLTWDSDYSISGYTSSWSIDCAPKGCTNTFADNYDSLAVADDGSCILSVTPGCMDALACNFDSLADVDDGSCYNNNVGCGCDQPAAVEGYDCAGNLVPLSCNTDNAFSFSGSYGSTEYFDYAVAEGEVATLDISGQLSYYYDDVYVYDGAGNLLTSFDYYDNYSYSFEDSSIVSNDNGISIEFYSSYSGSGLDAAYTIGCGLKGCIDPIAENYNPLAQADDGSCEYIYGCMDQIAENYDSLATASNDSCEYIYGCTDIYADNYDTLVTVAVDSLCIYSLLPGCMDSLACNYDSLAEQDNATCYNNDLGCGCDQPAAVSGYDCDGNVIILSCDETHQESYAYGNNDDTPFNYTFPEGEVASLNIVGETETRPSVGCYDYIYVYNGAGTLLETLCGDFDQMIVSNDNGISIVFDSDVSINAQGSFPSIDPSSWTVACVTLGCTDIYADNYDSLATADDGSCVLSVTPGCTDSLACNFDTLADVDNGTCYNNDLGCGCDEPAAALGYDCDGNLIPLVCGDSLNIGYYEYGNDDITSFDYVFTEGEIATVTISGETESCCDDVLIYDGAGALLATLDGSFNETIVSNDNGITIIFDSDYSISVLSPNYLGVPSIGTSWSLGCAVRGCTVPGAENYNEDAIVDDGSCEYADCNGLTPIIIEVTEGYAPNQVSWELNGISGGVGSTYTCIEDGCFWFNMYATDGMGWNSSTVTITSGEEVLLSGTSEAGYASTLTLSVNEDCEGNEVIYGCTDSLADNYNEQATDDDGLCEFSCQDFEVVVTHTASSAFAFEQSWNIFDSNGQEIASGPDVPEGELWSVTQEVVNVCLTEDEAYTLILQDSGLDGWNDEGSGGYLTIQASCGILAEGEVINVFESAVFIATCVTPDACALIDCDEGFQCIDGECVLIDTIPEPNPEPWDVYITGTNHTIVVPSFVAIDVDGMSLEAGDALGVFFTDDNGELQCAGQTVWTGSNNAIPAQGDDSTTDEVDGFVAGAEFVWKIWDASEAIEIMVLATYDESYIDQGNFVNNGYSALSGLTSLIPLPSSQNLNLPIGWSSFSTYINTGTMSMATLLSLILDDVIIAKNNTGSAYLPEWDFDGIGPLQVGQGYQIKLLNANDIVISGDYLAPEQNSIMITQGWNLIGYLRTESAAADAVLADMNISGNLIIAKDYNGQAYLPEWNFNGIGDMNPGEGYQLKTNNADVLQYLPNDQSYRMSTLEVTENHVAHFAKVAPTDNNMTVVIEDAVWDVLPTEGAEIAAFDKDGNLVGSAIYSSPATVLAVWGDDATTSSKDGLAVSEALSFKVWNTNDVRDFIVSKWIEGSSTYQVDAINIASSIQTHTIMTELNTPVRVLVKVINVLGQEVNMGDEPFKGTILFKVYDDGTVERFVK